MSKTVELVGVGFGPANIALAVALAERQGYPWMASSTLFLERRRTVDWHPGMLLEGSRLQVTFLKDFALLRNPTSPYTFLNYLKVHGRLDEFVNLRSLFPSRHEFDDYMKWVASHFDSCTRLGSEVVRLAAHAACTADTISRIAVTTAGGETLLARKLVLAVGARKRVPASFAGCLQSRRVVHAIDYLNMVDPVDLTDSHVVVIGAGQSAAEITYDLLSRNPQTRITAVLRGVAYRPPDESQFSGEVYFPNYVDHFHGLPAEGRESILSGLKSTNYSVVDPDLLHKLYRHLYEMKVRRMAGGLTILNHTEVTQAVDTEQAVSLDCTNRITRQSLRLQAQLVILATGFEHRETPRLLSGLDRFLLKDPSGRPIVQRDYRLACVPQFEPAIYVQGAGEATHGPADTLLSLSAVRAGEIAESLVRPDSSTEAATCAGPDRSARVIPPVSGRIGGGALAA